VVGGSACTKLVDLQVIAENMKLYSYPMWVKFLMHRMIPNGPTNISACAIEYLYSCTHRTG
jgi:hypothetical protein